MSSLVRMSSRLMVTMVLAGLCLGCAEGGSIAGAVPVSGKVTYQGKGVEGAVITFIGQGDAKTATAVSGADGSYELMTLDTKGAVPGEYTVVVEKTEMPEGADKEVSMEEAEKLNLQPVAPPKRLLPEKYSDPVASPLKVQVKPEGGTIDLELTD